MKPAANEMLLYYHKDSQKAKKILAFAKSIAPKVREMDYNKYKMNRILLKGLLDMMKMKPKELLNKSKAYYQSRFKDQEPDEETCMQVLVSHPELIKAPIAIKGNKAVFCLNPTDIFRLN